MASEQQTEVCGAHTSIEPQLILVGLAGRFGQCSEPGATDGGSGSRFGQRSEPGATSGDSQGRDGGGK